MAHFDDETSAPKRSAGHIPFVPLIQTESQDLNEKIVKFIELNHDGISEVAHLTKVSLEDAVQEAYLLLSEHSQYIHCVQDLRDKLCCKLCKYAKPKDDALTRARNMKVMPSDQENELDEALIKSEDELIEGWRDYEPTDELLDHLATVITKRPSGKRTALRVLKCIFENAGYTCEEVANQLGICLRRVQQIVANTERFLWLKSNHTFAITD